MNLLNFAYGSNMLSARLRERVPSARPVAVGVLRGFELRWHKLGQDGSGKCDVVRNDASCVHGVVYEIAVAEKPALDRAEGLGHGYAETRLDIETAQGLLGAWTYHALITDARAVPFTWYKALVVAGAREHGLPAGYRTVLEAAHAVDDEDAVRAARHFALAETPRTREEVDRWAGSDR